MNSAEEAKAQIRAIIAGSVVTEDARHAENTLEWLLKFDPKADQALQLAALAHDIDRAVEDRKVRRENFKDYEAFKAAHAQNSANMLREILIECGVDQATSDEACRLAALHEAGGDPRSDLLKDVDSVSFFEVNLPFYFEREGWRETKRRCTWGYRRLSRRVKKVVQNITYQDEALTRLVKVAIREAGQELQATPDP